MRIAAENKKKLLPAILLRDGILGIYIPKRKRNLARTLPSGGKP